MSIPDALARARALLERVPLVDGHNDLAWTMRHLAGYDLARLNVGNRLESTHTDLVRLREGRVGAQFWSVYVSPGLAGEAALTATLEQIDFVHRMVAAYPDQLGLATTADDVQQVFASGRIASLLGAEGGHSIACSLGALRGLYGLGVRYLTLTHSNNVPWADSATDDVRLGGLSPFGRQVVKELNWLGMLADLSHVSPGTMRDTLEVTDAPVIFSHSSCRGLVDHPRNVPDDVLARLPGNGGVCMVTFVPDFISEECRIWGGQAKASLDQRGLAPDDLDGRLAARREFEATCPRPDATVAQVADHVEHVREVAGVDHIGIGGDYDGCDRLPAGLEDVSGYPNLIAALLERGWSDEDCTKLAGGNVLRAFRQAEAVASRLRNERPASNARIDDLDPGQGATGDAAAPTAVNAS